MSVQSIKKLAPALKEIRIHLCPRSKESNGVRDFIAKYYTGIKSKNPDLPILVRECSEVQPKIWFRFEFGKETCAPLNNLSANEIADLLKDKVAS